VEKKEDRLHIIHAGQEGREEGGFLIVAWESRLLAVLGSEGRSTKISAGPSITRAARGGIRLRCCMDAKRKGPDKQVQKCALTESSRVTGGASYPLSCYEASEIKGGNDQQGSCSRHPRDGGKEPSRSIFSLPCTEGSQGDLSFLLVGEKAEETDLLERVRGPEELRGERGVLNSFHSQKKTLENHFHFHGKGKGGREER